MNVPNALTMARLGIALVSFVLMWMDYWMVASVLLLAAVGMDILDGLLARRLGQVSFGGVYLDVMADKIVIISTYLMLGIKLDSAFFLLGLLMLVREYTIDTMRSIAAAKQVVLSADKYSKIKGVMFMTAMLMMSFNAALSTMLPSVTLASLVIASVGMLLAYVTLGRFFLRYLRPLLS